MRAISQKILQPWITKMNTTITHLKFLSYLAEVNELKASMIMNCHWLQQWPQVNRIQSQWLYLPLATRFTAYTGCRWPYLTKGLAFYVDWNSLHWTYSYNQAYVLCCKYAKKICSQRCANKKLDISTARRRLKSPRSLSGTSAHPTMVTLVNIMTWS